MAAPIASHVKLPDDSGNPGKKIRTQTRVIGADTVHDHFYVQVGKAEVLGVYRTAMAQQTVAAAAQNGTSTGFLWAHVPNAITNKKARVRRFYFSSQHSTALATPTAPRIRLQRFTFTGTASGATIAPDKTVSTYPSPVFDLRTAVTGLTISLVGIGFGAAGLAGAITAVGAYHPVDIDVVGGTGDEDGYPTFATGEGFVIWQDTAGTTADTRKFNPVLVHDEIDTA